MAVIVAVLAFASAGMISAQSNTTNRTDTTTTRTADRDEGTDWGWLGLLGLAGLAGLIPRKKTVEVEGFRDGASNRAASAAGGR